MKQLKTIILLAFLLSTVSVFAEQKPVTLKLYPGQEILFQHITETKRDTTRARFNQFFKVANKEPTDEDIARWKKANIQEDFYTKNEHTVSIRVKQKVNPDKYVIEVKTERFITHLKNYGTPIRHYDNIFPPEQNSSQSLNRDDLKNSILHNITISFGINLKRKELVLLHSEQLENEIDKLLLRFQNSESQKPLTSEDIIKNDVEKLKKTVSRYLLDFIDFNINQTTQSNISKATITKSHTTDQIITLNTLDQKPDFNDIPNEIQGQYNISLKDGIILEAYNFSKPSKLYDGKHDNSFLLVTEHHEKFILLHNGAKRPVSITLRGEIDKPANRKIILSWMKSPFGTKLYSQNIWLNKDNSFEITIPFSKHGLLFLDNNAVDYRKRCTHYLYAMPGDTLIFTADTSSVWWMKFEGQRKKENKFLNDFQHQFEEFRSINPRFLINILKFVGSKSNKPLLLNELRYNSIDNFKKLIVNFKKHIDQGRADLNYHSYGYIRKELQMFINMDVIRILAYITNPGTKTRLNLTSDDYKKRKEWLDDYVNRINPALEANEDGYFSRQFIDRYFHYKYKTSCSYSYQSSKSNKGFKDTPMKQFYFAQMILAGSNLYKQIAHLVSDELTKSHDYTSPRMFSGSTAMNTQYVYEQILQTSKDRELNEQLKMQYERRQEIAKGNNLSAKAVFVTTDNKKVTISDFLGQKPVVICATNRWSSYRYQIDEIAAKNRDVLFLFICEGNSVEEWQDYLSRAEPVAHQLFLKNDTISLRDIFLIDFGKIIVLDKNGKIIKYGAAIDNVNNYIQKAQNSKPDNSESNKSTLKLIILILGGSLLFFIGGFLIWRYWSLKRLRKESMNRRMRELELTAIRSQMNPHFLYNSLNSVQNLVQQQRIDEAHLYLSDFAGLIRKVLSNTEKEEISLTEELETLCQYIRLEQLRTHFEFTIETAPEVDLYNTMLPPMLLQPIVENAILHGLTGKDGSRLLEIETTKPNGQIHIRIKDNGIGRKASAGKSNGNGKGIKLNADRLKYLQEKFGENYTMQIIDLEDENGNAQGTQVEICIPDEMD